MITNRKGTFDDVACGLCILMSKCESSTHSLGSLLLMLLALVPLMTPSLKVLLSGLLRSSYLLLMSTVLLLLRC